MYGALEISASGMTAQRRRLDVISANIANSGTTRTPEGGPWRRRIAIFEPVQNRRGQLGGVRVADVVLDQSPFNQRYDPNHPQAAQRDDPARGARRGYVATPNVNVVVEQMNAHEAARAYDANVAVAEATKTMMAQALQLLA